MLFPVHVFVRSLRCEGAGRPYPSPARWRQAPNAPATGTASRPLGFGVAFPLQDRHCADPFRQERERHKVGMPRRETLGSPHWEHKREDGAVWRRTRRLTALSRRVVPPSRGELPQRLPGQQGPPFPVCFRDYLKPTFEVLLLPVREHQQKRTTENENAPQTLVGCGTGADETRFAQRINQADKESPTYPINTSSAHAKSRVAGAVEVDETGVAQITSAMIEIVVFLKDLDVFR